MTMIQSRVTKLEEQVLSSRRSTRAPGISDERMTEIRRIAAVCDTWQDLAGYLSSLPPADRDNVVSLEDRRRGEAVTAALARMTFEEERR